MNKHSRRKLMADHNADEHPECDNKTYNDDRRKVHEIRSSAPS